MASVQITITDAEDGMVDCKYSTFPPIEELDDDQGCTPAQELGTLCWAFAKAWIDGDNPNLDGWVAELLADIRMKQDAEDAAGL